MTPRQREKRSDYYRHYESAGRGFGGLLEEEVEKCLRELKEDGLINDFTRHVPGSKERDEGKHFTVVGTRHGVSVHTSFGVSSSSVQVLFRRTRYEPVPQLWFSNSYDCGVLIRQAVLDLFDVVGATSA